jgi:hypothetical protein
VVRLTEVAATNNHTFQQSIPNFYGMRSDVYTFSTYLKKGDGANAPDIMQLSYGAGFANFNINTGVATASGSVLGASIQNAGSGWWRCIISGSYTEAPTNNPTPFIGFVNNNPTAVVRPTYSNGAGATSRNVFVYGSQFELSPTASAYQSNLVHPRLPSGFSSLFSPTPGTYWVNSSGSLQNVPYENLVWPSIRISSVANSITWRWIHVGLATPATGVSDPNGTFGATRINLGAGTSRADYMMSYQTSGNNVFSPSFPTSRIRTLILFVKQDLTDRYLGIRLNNGVNTGDYGNNAVTIRVDCSNGTLANNPTSYSITYTSQFVGNGWYKVCINRTDAWDSMLFQSSAALNTINNTPSAGVLIWGVQVLNGVYNINTPTYQRELGYSVPRLDYSGSSCPDYLLEQNNVNILLRSEEFNLSPWVTSSLTVTPNTEPAPNEELLADTLTATANGAFIRQSGTANSTITTRIFSVFLKRRTGTGNVFINMRDTPSTTTTASLSTDSWTRVFVRDVPISANYSTTAGAHTITTPTNHGFSTGDAIFFDRITGTAADVSTTITVTGPTTFTFNNGGLTTSGTCVIYSNTGRIVISTNGDEVYAWGAQIDLAISSQASGQIPFSYIPTTTAQVTRAVESMVTNLSGSASCSIYYELSRIGGPNSTTLSNIYLGNEASHGGATDGLSLSGNSFGTWVYSKKENNGAVTTVANPLLYGPGENRKTKILFNITGNNVNLWMDGSLINTTTFANPSRLLYNTLSTESGGQLRVSQVASFNKTLSTSEAQTLTYNPYFTNGTTELTFVLGRARAIGAESPSDSTLQALDTFIATLKTAGIWDKMDAVYNFAYNNTNVATFSRLNLKSTFYSLGVNGTMTYQTNGYLTGVGSSYLTGYTPGVNNVRYQPDSFSRTHILYQSAAGARIDANTINDLNDTFYNSSTNLHRALSNVNLPQSVDMSGTGLKSIMRNSFNSVSLYNQSTGTTLTQNRSGGYGTSQQFFPFGNGLGVGFSCFGAPLTQTDINTLRTAYNTYLSAIGLTPFA